MYHLATINAVSKMCQNTAQQCTYTCNVDCFVKKLDFNQISYYLKSNSLIMIIQGNIQVLKLLH